MNMGCENSRPGDAARRQRESGDAGINGSWDLFIRCVHLDGGSLERLLLGGVRIRAAKSCETFEKVETEREMSIHLVCDYLHITSGLIFFKLHFFFHFCHV